MPLIQAGCDIILLTEVRGFYLRIYDNLVILLDIIVNCAAVYIRISGLVNCGTVQYFCSVCEYLLMCQNCWVLSLMPVTVTSVI